MTPRQKIQVYTDGQCNLCRLMRKHVEPSIAIGVSNGGTVTIRKF